MNILFISRHKWPHIGGVEKHIKFVSEELSGRGYKVTTISEQDIKFPKVKFLGLVYIWMWFLRNIDLIKNSDIIHVHDVFIWFLPFRFLFPFKKTFVTFHGWEGKYPIPLWNILNKKVAAYLTKGNICVGKYIEKYYGVSADYVLYGAVDKIHKRKCKKIKNSLVWLGRRDNDTGFLEFQSWLIKQRVKYSVKYITNHPNPEKYLQSAEYSVPSGYLSYLESKNMGCKLLTFPNNPLKVDYWIDIKNSKLITWAELTNIYIKLWQKN